jgi:hypothetical protein
MDIVLAGFDFLACAWAGPGRAGSHRSFNPAPPVAKLTPFLKIPATH